MAGALGELTGYLVGLSGRDLIARGKWYDKAEYWTKTYGFWCIAFFAFIPNPFFDAIGFAAGVLRYSVWKFAISCWIGKAGKFYVAAMGSEIVGSLCYLYPPACSLIEHFVRTMIAGD